MFAFYIFVFSLWQQAGRSGRRGKPSLAVYIALEGPLDQYFMKFPQKLFGSPIECCQVDAHNQQVFLLVFTHGPFFFFFFHFMNPYYISNETYACIYVCIFIFESDNYGAFQRMLLSFISIVVFNFEDTGTRW